MGTGGEDARKRTLDWLDYGRFLAAVSVVAFHYISEGPRAGRTGDITSFGVAADFAKYGYLGVDFFFLISGFVILFSALGRSADRFAVSRVVRLWFTFVLCLTITTLTLNAIGGADYSVDLARYLLHLTMIPNIFGQVLIDGVYWTLAFEIAFYGAIFLIIAIGQMHRITSIIIAWVGLMVLARLAGLLFDAPPLPFLGGYFTLFASGCLLALIQKEGPRRALLVALGAAVILTFDATFVRTAHIKASVDPWVAATLVTLLFLPFLVFRKGGPSLPAARTLGRITYPLYLLHAQIGYALLRLLHIDKWLAVGLVATLMLLLSLAVYLAFEMPTERLRIRLTDATIGRLVRLVTGWPAPDGPTR